MAVNMEKCAFFQKDIEWLGFKITLSGVKTIGWDIRFNKKSPKPEEYLQIKIILWFNKPIQEIRSETNT